MDAHGSRSHLCHAVAGSRFPPCFLARGNLLLVVSHTHVHVLVQGERGGLSICNARQASS
jgi:hypothetical protein